MIAALDRDGDGFVDYMELYTVLVNHSLGALPASETRRWRHCGRELEIAETLGVLKTLKPLKALETLKIAETLL